MEKKMIMNYKKRFDEIRHEENGVEFWYARELMHLLDYSKWQNFENVLLKAKVACANNGKLRWDIAAPNHMAELFYDIVSILSFDHINIQIRIFARYPEGILSVISNIKGQF